MDESDAVLLRILLFRILLVVIAVLYGIVWIALHGF